MTEATSGTATDPGVGGTDPDVGATSTSPPRSGSLLRANGVVAAGTLLSRVTGVVRLAALVAAVGPSLQDTYLLANNTPNIVYELILGGILTATLVPLFTDNDQRNDTEATDAVVSVTLVSLVGLTVVAGVLSPLLILFYSLNAEADTDQVRSVGITLALLFVPQVFFYGAMAMGSALLNARKRFFAAAWAPVLNNLIVSAVLIAVAVTRDRPVLADADGDRGLQLVLGLGTTAGIAAMTVSLLPALRRAGYRFRFHVDLHHPAVRRAVRLSGWTLGYVAANQVAAQVVNLLATGDVGRVAAYQVAFMFFQLPHGLLAVSLMTTIQPDLARAAGREDWPDFHRRLLQGLRLLFVVVVPAAIAYLVLSLLLVQLRPDLPIFRPARENDLFDYATALGGFALGLIGFSAYLFVLRAFYAVKDTRRPFYVNVGENVLNVVAATALVVPFGLVGLTSAYALAYLVFAIVALVVLLRHLPTGFDARGLADTLGRSLGAAAVMAAVMGVVVVAADRSDPDLTSPALAVAIVLGAVAYVGAATGLGLHRTAGLSTVMARRRGR